MNREQQINILYFVAAVFAVLLIGDLLGKQQHVRAIPYSEFQSLLEKGEVKDLVVGDKQIRGSYVNPADAKVPHFTTLRVEPALAQDLGRARTTFSGEAGPGILESLLAWLLPSLGFILLWMFLVRPMAGGHGGLMSIGKSRAKVYVETDTKVTFADVAGVDEAKEELAEVVGFLKEPKKHSRLGGRVPKGVLLVGPPGTGKTLLARAVAGEAGVPFFSISGSEFVEMFVGVGAARVRDLFEQARKRAPAIIFIDELDALGRARGSVFPGGGHDEKEQTLNQLLTELDGFDASSGVVLLAATNRPEILDPALLRAGRFDRQVLVDRPERKGRVDILNVHLKRITLAPNLDIEAIAGLTPGFTGADLANLVNEAALVATRRGSDATALEDFTEAIERIVAGLEKKSRILNPKERETVAFHEIGHAMVAMALPGSDPVQKVSIIPRGIAALGYTMQRPIEDRFLMNRAELIDRMTVLLGGRAAETLVFPEVSTGAADDLAKATEIARSMVMRFGMAPELGPVAFDPEQRGLLPGAMDWRPRAYAEETAAAIDRAVKGLIETALKRAVGILEQQMAALNATARLLLERETLSGDDLARLATVNTEPKVFAGHGGSAQLPVAAAHRVT